MQIVIDIDEDVYNALHGKNTKVINMLDILNAIRNGTVLPENHGRVRYIKCEVLDKIRAEIEAIIGENTLDDYDFCSGLICARKIIDKHNPDKVGKEREDKTE